MRRITAKVGSYTGKDGKEKGRYVDVGVVMDGEHGEYAMLYPYINLQVVHQMQTAMNRKANKEARDSITVNFFESDRQQSESSQPSQNESYPEAGGGDIGGDIPF